MGDASGDRGRRKRSMNGKEIGHGETSKNNKKE